MDNKNKITVNDIRSGKRELLGFDPEDCRECTQAIMEDGYNIRFADPDIITYSMAVCAVVTTPWAIMYVPERHINTALMVAAVCKEPEVAWYLANIGKGDDDVYTEAIRKDWEVLKDLARVATYNMCMEAVMSCGLALQYVPMKFRDANMCYKAVSKNAEAIKYAPVATYNMCMEAVMSCGLALQYVPMKFRDANMCYKAVSKNAEAIKYAPVQNDDIAMLAIQEDVENLKYLTTQSDEVCKKACSIDGLALEHVRCKTAECCAIALQQCNEAAQFIPRCCMGEVVDILNGENKGE